ncbi:MAG: TRAP transporter substrate-binding protein [Betaproteobacteria bacterium]|nr:TRAP transporter substrate-binding protein [Betaproteobacteria bacterium]
MTIQICMGGYGPPTTTHSRALRMIGDRLIAQFGKEVGIKYVWNVMDFGYKAEEVLWMSERGILTLAYQSTSYLTERVPELEFADLPFLFASLNEARAAMDGKLGAYLSRKIEERIPGYRMLGYFENGYRHVSNRLRPVHTLADLADMRIRMMPSQMHCRTFELLGAIPFACDLKQGLEAIMSGAVDAQENPLANTIDYGAHKAHRYITLTGHCYVSRGIYCNRAAFDSWPEALQTAMKQAVRAAIIAQRGLAVEEERIARINLESAGCEIVELTPEERAAFVRAVKPLHDEARTRFGEAFAAL